MGMFLLYTFAKMYRAYEKKREDGMSRSFTFVWAIVFILILSLTDFVMRIFLVERGRIFLMGSWTSVAIATIYTFVLSRKFSKLKEDIYSDERYIRFDSRIKVWMLICLFFLVLLCFYPLTQTIANRLRDMWS